MSHYRGMMRSVDESFCLITLLNKIAEFFAKLKGGKSDVSREEGGATEN